MVLSFESCGLLMPFAPRWREDAALDQSVDELIEFRLVVSVSGRHLVDADAASSRDDALALQETTTFLASLAPSSTGFTVNCVVMIDSPLLPGKTAESRSPL